MLHTITKEEIFKACRHCDSIGSPFWLEELIDLGISYLQTDLPEDEYNEMCEIISKGMY